MPAVRALNLFLKITNQMQGQTSDSASDYLKPRPRPSQDWISVAYNDERILKVGIQERRFISRRHLATWTVECQARGLAEAERSSSDVTNRYRIQCRPWRTVHGDLNLAFLRQAVHTLLSYLFHRPGQAVSDVLARFDPHMLPGCVLDLIDLLQELKCLEVTSHRKPTKPTIFGTPEPHHSEPGWLCCHYQALHPTVEGPIQIGLFLRALEQHCQNKQPHTN